ncbi:uncharacterized protein LOC110814171 [Carica papaya]|uniref:uncharacterized protein LOC110814171 n=1 Tax=Carica papaya TaxID=3649 RepID=UPI000B8D0A06|nr:uncharacterized protein LOC110814171 [Carica papaya]
MTFSSKISLIFSFIILTLLGCCLIGVRSAPDLPGGILLPSDKDGDFGVCAGVTKPTSCPVNCFRTEPVCGVDGVTYWCGCADAMCAGARVAKLGFCEVRNGGSASVPGQALLLIHIVWLILLGLSVLFGLF